LSDIDSECFEAVGMLGDERRIEHWRLACGLAASSASSTSLMIP
jgi:hypothetical protein